MGFCTPLIINNDHFHQINPKQLKADIAELMNPTSAYHQPGYKAGRDQDGRNYVGIMAAHHTSETHVMMVHHGVMKDMNPHYCDLRAQEDLHSAERELEMVEKAKAQILDAEKRVKDRIKAHKSVIA